MRCKARSQCAFRIMSDKQSSGERHREGVFWISSKIEWHQAATISAVQYATLAHLACLRRAIAESVPAKADRVLRVAIAEQQLLWPVRERH